MDGGRHYKLTLAWRGTAYVGWQRQPNGLSLQGVVEDAASAALGGEEVRVTASGRTDAGVHALAQVASLKAMTAREPRALLAAMNWHLPLDVAVTGVSVAPDGFDVRRWVLRKLYRYRVLNRVARCPFREDQTWRWRGRLDVDAMHAAARALEGRHDFSGFRAEGCGAHHPVRLIERASVLRRDDEIHFEFVGNGFLRHQVRIMTGTLMEVGMRRFAPEHIADVLARRDRKLAGKTAPPEGLWLVHVEHGDGPRVAEEEDLD